MVEKKIVNPQQISYKNNPLFKLLRSTRLQICAAQ